MEIIIGIVALIIGAGVGILLATTKLRKTLTQREEQN